MDLNSEAFKNFMAQETLVGGFVVALVLLTFFELGYDYLRHYPRDYKDTWANIVIGVVFEIVFFTPAALAVMLSLVAIGHRLPWRIPNSPLSWIAALLAVDFFYYWSHRLEHRFAILWATHHTHHSSRDFNLTTAHRLHFTLPFYGWFRPLPVVLMGFDPFVVLILFHALIALQIPLHTQHIGRLGWLDRVLNTPSNHRVHHGSSSEHIDRNFGGIFIFWDRLFGSYRAEEGEVIYGLPQNIETRNPVWIYLHEPVRLVRSVIRR